MSTVYEVRVPASADVADGPDARPDALAVFADEGDAATFALSSGADLRVVAVDVIDSGGRASPGTVPYREQSVPLPNPNAVSDEQLQKIVDEGNDPDRLRAAAQELIRRASR